MTGFNCPRTGNQLMVDSLINFRLATLFCQPTPVNGACNDMLISLNVSHNATLCW